MELFFIAIGIIMLVGVITAAYALGLNQGQNTDVVNDKVYVKKVFMTKCELDFYNKIKELELYYRIVPQVNLASIIDKIGNGYRNELFRNIDFAIFDQDYQNILLLIELNDNTHNNNDRKDRDLRVKKICSDAGIKLITFHTKYPNEKEYVLNRIKEQLINSKE